MNKCLSKSSKPHPTLRYDAHAAHLKINLDRKLNCFFYLY